MLTILAFCHSYIICDDEFVLKHYMYAKAKAVADMLAALRKNSVNTFPKDDPRYGLITGPLTMGPRLPTSTRIKERQFTGMRTRWKPIGGSPISGRCW